MSLVFDPLLCTGCQACQMACLDQRDIRPMEGQAPLLRVEPAKDPGCFRAVFCIRCGLCAEACPTGCLQMENGSILVRDTLCIGCGACARVCPQGVIAFSDNVVQICDGCAGRRAEGLAPACIHTCPTGALRWED